MNNASFSFGGSIPELYDRYLGPYIFEPYARDIADRIKLPVKQVLEVAAGTGRVTRHIAGRVGKEARFTVTDINADMLAVARQRVTAPNIEWMTANATELPFEDNYFDCVVCQFGFMFLNDRQKGFDEALRVLKPGGQFLFSTWDKVENNITAYISRQVVSAFFKDNPPEFYKIPFSMYDPAELEAHLFAAGFGNYTVQRVSFIGESESAMNIATGFIEGNPIITEIVKHSPPQLEQIKTMIAEQIHSQVSSDPVRSPMHAWVGEGYK